MGLHFSKEIGKRELIANGEYETAMTCEWDKTSSGDPYIKCVFEIRKDVQQDFGGRIVYDGIYKSKSTGDFNISKINGLLAAIKNSQQDFEDYDDLIQYLNGKCFIIEIETQLADPTYPNSKDKNVVKYLSYKETKALPQGVTPLEVQTDELPF